MFYITMHKISRLQMLIKIVVKNFAIFKGKHLYWSLFNKVGLQACKFIQKRLTGVFLWIMQKILRTAILKNIYKQLLLYANYTYEHRVVCFRCKNSSCKIIAFCDLFLVPIKLPEIGFIAFWPLMVASKLTKCPFRISILSN